MAVLVYFLVGFLGMFFGIPIFPDPSLGILMFGRLLFAGLFVAVVVLVVATAPLYLK